MRHYVITAGLAPLLLAQGRMVRRVTPVLPEADGPRSGVCGVGQKLRLLMTGDSSAAGVGVAHIREATLGQTLRRLAPHFQTHWRLIAKTGDTTADAIARLERAQPFETDIAITSLGVNDVTGNKAIPRWLRHQKQLVSLLRTKFKARHVLVSGLPPVYNFPALPQPLRWYLGARSVQLDRALERFCANEPDVTFVPLFFGNEAHLMASDGFHPSAYACTSWGWALAQEVRSWVARDPFLSQGIGLTSEVAGHEQA